MYLLILIDWYGTIISSSCEQLFMQREILYLFAILHCTYVCIYVYPYFMLAEKETQRDNMPDREYLVAEPVKRIKH